MRCYYDDRRPIHLWRLVKGPKCNPMAMRRTLSCYNLFAPRREKWDRRQNLEQYNRSPLSSYHRYRSIYCPLMVQWLLFKNPGAIYNILLLSPILSLSNHSGAIFKSINYILKTMFTMPFGGKLWVASLSSKLEVIVAAHFDIGQRIDFLGTPDGIAGWFIYIILS